MTKSLPVGLLLISLFLIGCGANRGSSSTSSSGAGVGATPQHSPGDHARDGPAHPRPFFKRGGRQAAAGRFGPEAVFRPVGGQGLQLREGDS